MVAIMIILNSNRKTNGVQIFLKKWVTWCFASGTKK